MIELSFFASSYRCVYKLVNQIWCFAPSVKILLGSPEVSANRKEVMQLFSKVDYLLVEEAEYTLVQLANCTSERDETGIKKSGNLSCLKDGEVQHNPISVPIKDIDNILFSRRDLFSTKIGKKFSYHPGLGRPTDVILASRGCPFKCRFCYCLTCGYRARSPKTCWLKCLRYMQVEQED